MRNTKLVQSVGARIWIAAVCVAFGAMLTNAAYADGERGRGHARKPPAENRALSHAKHRDHWRDHRREPRRGEWEHRHRAQHWAPDWRYYHGRHWAPAHYRGRRCNDHRHHHGVHYHVLARDYYDYYYPRFRYYGPRPRDLSASVIITVPLF